MIRRGCFSLKQHASIDFIMKNAINGHGAPHGFGVGLKTGTLSGTVSLLVFNRRQNTFCIQPVRNLLRRHSFDLPFENILYNTGCIGINHKPVFVVRASQIAVHNTAANKLSTAALGIKVGSDLDGNIAAVGVIHQIFEWKNQIVFNRPRLSIVVVVVDGNKANTQSRKNFLQVVTGINIFTPEARKVFHNDAVDLPITDRIHHLLELRPLKIRACKSIIAIFTNHRNLRMVLQKISDQHALIGDTVAFSLFSIGRGASIFFGQAQINRALKLLVKSKLQHYHHSYFLFRQKVKRSGIRLISTMYMITQDQAQLHFVWEYIGM